METSLRYAYMSRYGYPVLSANRYSSEEDFIKHIGYFASPNKKYGITPCLDCNVEPTLKLFKDSY